MEKDGRVRKARGKEKDSNGGKREMDGKEARKVTRAREKEKERVGIVERRTIK